MPIYNRPPITEASFEIRLLEPLENSQLEALNRRLAADYDSSNEFTEFAVGLNVKRRETMLEERDRGYRLENKDRTNVLLVKSRSFVCSRLAPYEGWDKFLSTCMDGWTTWKKVIGVKKIDRIGLRYINRIDIPIKGK